MSKTHPACECHTALREQLIYCGFSEVEADQEAEQVKTSISCGDAEAYATLRERGWRSSQVISLLYPTEELLQAFAV